MNNDLDKLLKAVRVIAEGVSDFLNKEEVKILTTKLASGLQQLG